MLRHAALGLLATAALTASPPARAADKVLRVAPITDVQMLDPLFGSARVKVVAGEMLYETLFSRDSALHPKPQVDAAPYAVLGQAEQLLAFRKEVSGVP